MPKMIYIGNLKTYFDGRLVIGVKYQQAVGSAVGLLGLFLLSLPYYIITILNYVNNKGDKVVQIVFIASMVFWALQFAIMSITLYWLLLAAFSDCGILPGRELQEKFVDELKSALEHKQKSMKFAYKPIYAQPQQIALKPTKVAVPQKDNNLNSRAFKIINSTHKPETPLKFSALDWNFTLKYCQSCRFYRPLRATHGGKSNCCIQRYDHFCAWIGTDVAYHNHGYFYLMMFFNCIYFILCLVVYTLMIAASLYYLITKKAPGGTSTYLASICTLVCCCGGIPGASYILHSLMQLMTYHRNLSVTGTLTKEDSGADNASISGPFSFFNVKSNMLLNMRGMSKERILHKTIMSHKYLLRLVKSNPYIVNFDSLGRILKMNGFLQFQELNKEDPGDQVVKKSFRDMFEDGNEQTYLINENIQFVNILTVRDAVEFAIKRSKEWVILNKDNFERLKETRPELFKQQGNITRDGMAMVKMCDKGAPKAAESKPQQPYPLPVPSI